MPGRVSCETYAFGRSILLGSRLDRRVCGEQVSVFLQEGSISTHQPDAFSFELRQHGAFRAKHPGLLLYGCHTVDVSVTRSRTVARLLVLITRLLCVARETCAA